MAEPQVPPEEVARILREQAARHAEAVQRLQSAPPPEAATPSLAERAKALVALLRAKLDLNPKPVDPREAAPYLPRPLAPIDPLAAQADKQRELTKPVP